MSVRLNAPARSPLRRSKFFGEDGPNLRKASKSPVRLPRFDKKPPVAKADPEADALRAQADQIDHELSHLSPALQRFWQRAKIPDAFSPRSRRLSLVLPQPKSIAATTLAKLSHVRGQVADELERSRKVQELTSGCLKRHFEIIPPSKLSYEIHAMFNSFDINRDGFLDQKELKEAFMCMGKKVSDEEMKLIVDEYDKDGNNQFDSDEFEEMIRVALNLEQIHKDGAMPGRLPRKSV